MLHNVAILYHPLREQAISQAMWLAEALQRHGVETVVGDGWDPDVVRHMCCDRELVIAFGGDGTIIRIARFAAPAGIAVVGVNLGRVGFLAELTPEKLRVSVGALVHQTYWLEKHTMLDVTHRSEGGQETILALNEVVVARGGLSHAVHVSTLLNGEDFVTYTADGVLLSTATGSTAYSLAAGGPILYPESSDMLITPVAPHLHIGRSVIVPGSSTVTMRLASDRPGLMSVDGADERRLTQADSVEVRRSETVAHFARLEPPTYFYAAIADRLR